MTKTLHDFRLYFITNDMKKKVPYKEVTKLCSLSHKGSDNGLTGI